MTFNFNFYNLDGIESNANNIILSEQWMQYNFLTGVRKQEYAIQVRKATNHCERTIWSSHTISISKKAWHADSILAPPSTPRSNIQYWRNHVRRSHHCHPRRQRYWLLDIVGCTVTRKKNCSRTMNVIDKGKQNFRLIEYDEIINITQHYKYKLLSKLNNMW